MNLFLLVSFNPFIAILNLEPKNSYTLTGATLEISENLHHAFSVLSIFASAVGSQATITASFSIINQCQALSCFPRVKAVHTSEEIHGQVYVPDVNWLFMLLCIGITVGFHQIYPIGMAAGTNSSFSSNNEATS